MKWHALGLLVASLLVVAGVAFEMRAVFFTKPGELRTALTLVGYVLMGVGVVAAWALESHPQRPPPV